MNRNGEVEKNNLIDNFEHLFIALNEPKRYEIKYDDISFVIFIINPHLFRVS